ncbi:MAG: gephyrin-like molybdotransferase Glp [Bacteroidales bacterium]
MITIEKAYQTVIGKSYTLETEKIDFIDSVGRILAEDVTSDIEMPPFDKSSMDGYACRRADVDNTLEIIEIIPAGKTPTKRIGPNQCAKIMTGAPVPEGADFIAMVEYAEEIDDKYVKINKITQRNNISYRAEDVKIDQLVLQKGIKIKPQHIAVFASVGYTNVLVTKQPRVAIISTGDELVEPHKKPGISQIRNSNGYQLITQVKSCGAIANYIGIADDTPEDTFNKVSKALSENDLVLLTGGVSMGSFDFVPEVLKKAGIEILFDSIAVTPGKPTTFGVTGKKFCFGLPGNPVSSFIQFELLVKPLIYKLMGFDFQPLDIQMPMGIEFKRKKTDRKAYIPVFIKDGEVFPVEYHGSAHIHALSFAHVIIAFPIGVDTLLKGEIVHVRQI